MKRVLLNLPSSASEIIERACNERHLSRVFNATGFAAPPRTHKFPVLSKRILSTRFDGKPDLGQKKAVALSFGDAFSSDTDEKHRNALHSHVGGEIKSRVPLSHSFLF